MGIPKQLYSDYEAGTQTDTFRKLMNKHSITHITTIAGAHGVERFNRTLKEKIQTRLDAQNLDRDKWLSQLYYVLNKYNDTVHSTINMTPNDAKKKKNLMVVRWELANSANKSRKYPSLDKGDKVRVMQKKELGKTKGYFPKWSKDVFKIVAISGQNYMIDDGKRRLYIRSELLKV